MLAMRYHGTGPWYKDCGVQGYKYRTKIWFPLTKVHHRVQHWREIRAPRMNIILSSGHSPARHLDNGKRRGNSKHSWRSPPRDAERKEEISAQKCGKIDTKWHMNDEHGASKRNSVLLVLLTKKQMVPIHKNEIIEKSKITKWERCQNTKLNMNMDD